MHLMTVANNLRHVSREKKIMMNLQQHELNIVQSRKGTFSLSFF